MRKGTLTVKLKFKVLPDGLSGQSVAGEPVFPASIAQGNTFEVDISPICDTRKAEVKYSLVSNSLESVTDTAKIYIPASLDAYNIAFKRKLVQSIIYCATERERVWATIDYEATRLFTGIVDLSNLTIQSYSYQGDIELVLKDNGYLLDEKIAQSIELPVQAFPRFNSASSPKTKGVYYKDPDNANAFYFWNGSAWAHKESFSDTESKYFHPDATVRVWSSSVVDGELVESVVGTLLGMAGYSVSEGTIDPSASDTSTSVVRCFTYDMSEDKTYKEVLDTLLKEYRMCLTFTPEGKVRIVSLSHTSIHATRDIGYGLKGTLGRRDGIKTTFEASKKDGVKLKYSSGLAVRREQSIYSENLGSEFDENGELKGTAIKPQQCLPETGDITATYQEYNAKFLDRAYTTKVNRKENEDLSIISTHGHHLEVAQKGGTLTYPAFTVGESAEHGTGANPYFMPKKAQVLFRNDYEMKNKDPDSTEYEEEAESHSIYLQIFNIVADVLYRDKTTTIYAPSATANPETYESTYLFDDGPARTFANFYLGWNQYGAMKTDWTEYKGTVDTIGSIIGYQHTDSAISSYCLLSEETISFTGSPDVPFVIKMHGIGIAPYNDKPVQSVSYMGDNKNRGENGATGPKGETGASGTDGRGIASVAEYYMLSDQQTAPSVSDSAWSATPQTPTTTKPYLWKKTVVSYTSGSPTVSMSITGRSVAGWSQATLQLFKRSATAPAKYDGSALTYTFSTATLAGNKGSWSITIPSGSDPLYVIYAPAFGQGETDIVETSDWTVPAILSENGTRGENGDTVATVMLYQRSASTPSSPSGVVTYNFLSGAVSNTGSWSNTVPASNGNPLWVITAVASVTGSSNVHEDTIQPSEWSTPAIMAKDGANGADGNTGAPCGENLLLSALTAGGNTTVEGNAVRWNGSIADTYFYIRFSELPIVGRTYTLSCDCSDPDHVLPSSGWAFGIFGQTLRCNIFMKEGRCFGTFVLTQSLYDKISSMRAILDDAGARPSTSSTNVEFSKFKLEEGSIPTAYCLCVAETIGPKGDPGNPGATGTSVTGIVEEYALSTSSTSVTGTWGTAVPTLTPTNRYLWNRSKTQYSNGTASGYTTPVVIGVYGDKGDTGGTGATGRGISGITEYYLASTSSTAPSASDTGWSTSAQTPTEAKPYLWNKTVVAYTSGSPTTTIAMIGQSIKGNPGATGATGNGIKSVTVSYGVSSSASTQPTSWSSTIPAVAENQFLWTRTITDYTNDAVADTVTYTYAKQGKSGSAGTSVTVSSIQYQAGTSATTAPTGTWSNNPVSVAQGQYLWTKTTFSDGKVAYGVTRQGVDGDSPELMVIDTDTILLNAYADGPVKNYDGAEINASVTINNVVQTGWAFSIGSKTNVSVSVNSSTGKYTVTAMDEGKRTGSFVITAKKGGKTLNTQAYVQKLYDTGMVSVSASGASFGFYADNVPHNASESIEITVALTGFSASYAPPCTLDGDSVTLTNGKYVVTPSMLSGKDSVMFVATGTYNTSSVVISKILDIASMSLSISRTTFGYYADNYPHTGETPCVATVIASGLSTAPTIKVNGISKTLTASSPKYTLTIANSDLAEGTAPTLVEATYGTITRSLNIEKVFDVPTITINLTKDFFQYYADGVIRDSEDSIGVSITYRGLYEKPVFKYGSNVTLGTSTLYDYLLVPSPTWINDGFFVEAYSSHIDTSKLFTATFIKCSKDQPSISLVASATQFHQTGNGTASPQTITVTPEVAGLSASAKITYTFGAETITLTNGSYVINSSDVSTYKTMTASWNNTVYGSLTILKTVDGKSMSYMYASCPEAYLPGGYPFGTDSNAIGEADTAIGASYGWSESVPDVPDGYVLWIKTISPDGKMFIYRPQGLEGKSEGVYLGTGTSTNLPTKRPDGSDIKEGDYYLDITDTTSPVPYEMKNGTWTAIDGSSAKWTRVASAVQGDVAKYCPNISNSNGLYGFFKNLSAVNGFVDGLGTRQLTITNGGYIQSQSYADSNGLEGFYLPDDGNAIFETGLFRGGISNGWTIFGGLDIDVTETMTQKELYSAFRMAGVGNGLYFSLGLFGNYSWKNQHVATSNPYASLFEYGFTKYEPPVMWQDFSANDFSSPAYVDVYALGETTFLLIAYANTAYHAYKIDTSFLHNPDTTQTHADLVGLLDALQEASTIGASPYSTDVSGIISGNEHAYDLYLVANDKLYIGTTTCTVLDQNLNTLGTLKSSDGSNAALPLLWSKPSMVTYGHTSYMYMVINGSLCFASSTDGLVWTKGFNIPSGEDYTQNYYYYSPVLVDGTWYCLRAIYGSSAKSVTMQFCKTSGTAFVVVKEFSSITYDDYNDSEMNFLAYGEGKVLFSCPSDKVLYIYDIATKKLESDYSLANVPVYREYIGKEDNVSANGASLLGNEYIEIQNLTAVHGIWFDNSKKRFIILLATKDDMPVLRFFYPDTMKSEYISTFNKAEGLKMNYRAYGNTLWFDGDKIAFGYKGSFYTLEPMIKMSIGENIFGLPPSTKVLNPYPYSPDAMSAELDLNQKQYKLHFYFNSTWVREGNDDQKDITIDGTSNALVPFAGKFCLRPSITAPRGAIISGAKFLMTGTSTS